MKYLYFLVFVLFLAGCTTDTPNKPPVQTPTKNQISEPKNTLDLNLTDQDVDMIIRPVLESDSETQARNITHFEMIMVEPGPCEGCLLATYEYRIINEENAENIDVGQARILLEKEKVTDIDWEYTLPDPSPLR